MIEFIGEAIGQLFLLIPSKKQKIFKKKFIILKQKEWFKNKYSSGILFDNQVKEFITNYDIDNMIKSDSEIEIFKKKLDELLLKIMLDSVYIGVIRIKYLNFNLNH
ncbi:hypothetical protein MHB52_31745 [Bacillus sp. FSL K6-0073]|uniref:hypothetical protein n=1 Tax=Bacillus sp. FSL K6-0073 TaxID=2921414 RepID=UPI0030F9B35A